MTEEIVIIGAGQAGFALAAELRALGDLRHIVMLSDEMDPPYERPPLTKDYLRGSQPFEQLLFGSQGWYADNGIDLRLGCQVRLIDRIERIVRLGDGTDVPYSVLALTTGSDPRRLPTAIGGDLIGVHVARDKNDADKLALEMKRGRRGLIIGGGYLGLETAAVANELGVEVTVVEIGNRILGRVAAPATADRIAEIHRQKGVNIRVGTGVVRLIEKSGQVATAVLSNGDELEIDFVVVGIGASANDRLASEAGLAVSDGVLVDAFGRTADPAIFAAGDCARFIWRGARIRLESVQNAIAQAEAVAAVMAGSDRPYEPKPWFWSDQYDLKLQTAGFNAGYDEVIVRPGPRQNSFSVWYFGAGTLLAVDAVNDSKAFLVARKLLDAAHEPSRLIISDPEADLKDLLPPKSATVPYQAPRDTHAQHHT